MASLKIKKIEDIGAPLEVEIDTHKFILNNDTLTVFKFHEMMKEELNELEFFKLIMGEQQFNLFIETFAHVSHKISTQYMVEISKFWAQNILGDNYENEVEKK